jgi:hypothetical protein
VERRKSNQDFNKFTLLLMGGQLATPANKHMIAGRTMLGWLWGATELTPVAKPSYLII